MLNKVLRKSVLLLLGATFVYPSAYALNRVIGLDLNAPAWVLSDLLTEPDHVEHRYAHLPPESKISPYERASNVLILGDTFDKAFPLGEEISVLFPKTSTLKTSLSCPAEQDGVQLKANLKAQRLDHGKDFDLSSDSFDVIVMKSGLCCCESPSITCAGIVLSQNEVFRFLSEVVRVLNKKNSEAIAFLQGSQMAFRRSAKVSLEQEAMNQKILQLALLQLEEQYPEIETELFFKSVTGQFALLKLGAQESLLKEIFGGKEFDESFSYLDGIFIRVKGNPIAVQPASGPTASGCCNLL